MEQLEPNACPAQPQEFGDLQSGEDVYAYAGSEPDVPVEGLASIASTAEGFTVYADAAQQPPLELLLDTGADVVRFVLLDDQGRPPVLGETLQFQGVTFAFQDDAAGIVDTATLAPVGCAGPFQLSAPVDQVDAGTVDQLYATVGARLLSYRAADAAQIGATPETTEPIQEVADQGAAVEAETGTPAPEPDMDAEATAARRRDRGDRTWFKPCRPRRPQTTSWRVTRPRPPRRGRCPWKSFWMKRASVLTAPCQSIRPAWSRSAKMTACCSLRIPGGPPFDRLYGTADIAAGRPGRYLAEQPIGPDGTPSPAGRLPGRDGQLLSARPR